MACGSNPCSDLLGRLEICQKVTRFRISSRLLGSAYGGDGKIEAVAGAPGQFQITIRFSNCLGSLSNVEASNCKGISNNNDKRVISFLFRI